MKTRILLLASVLFFSFSATSQSSWETKVDPLLLNEYRSGQNTRFIVMLSEQADLSGAGQLKTKSQKAWYVFNQLRQTAHRTQGPVQELLAARGATYRSFFLINALAVQGPPELIRTLAERADVRSLVSDSPVMVETPMPEPEGVEFRGPTAVEWGIERINADDVWAMGFTGQGVVIGGQDTGYDWDHPALIQKYRGYTNGVADHNYNWHDAIHEINPLHNDSIPGAFNNPCGLDIQVPCDDQTHGTHTMGTMVGAEGDNQIGVAPDASWIGCRNMERGYGSPSTYIECFEWFLAPTDLSGANADPDMAPHVINNSWSCPEMEGCNPSNFALMEAAVANLKLAGVVVVVSAGNSGNDGCNTVSTPAAIFENSFTVGATAQSDTITGFSSRGPVLADGSGRLKPNVSAPGRQVRSCVPGTDYASYSGTSMAGPHVAGLVALLISANPELAGQVEVIENIIEQTAVPKFTDENCGGVAGTEHPNNTYGYGRVDALAAVTAALELAGVEVPEDVSPTLKVFPNPFDQSLVLEGMIWRVPAAFRLYDAAGREVYSRTWTEVGVFQETLELPGLPAGVYLYTLTSGEQVLRGKVARVAN